MAQLWEYVKLALMNIRSNKVRTFLTMLGIIIGVSSVILIISVGNGISAEITGTLSDIAGGQIYISARESEDAEDIIEFTSEDMEVLVEKIDGIRGATSMPIWATKACNTILRMSYFTEDILPERNTWTENPFV